MAPDRSLCRFPSLDKPSPSPSPPNATTFAGTEYDTIMDTTTIQSPPRPRLPLDAPFRRVPSPPPSRPTIPQRADDGAMKRRHIQIYGDYFTDFFEKQNEQVRLKILKVLEIIETIDRIPETYLKHLRDGLFEIRIQLGSSIFRIFCFFDNGRLIILLGGFQKKTQKTPAKELERALRLMKIYHNEKENKQE